MAVDLKDVEKEQYTPLGTKLKIGTLSNLEKLRIMSQEDDARGALMRGVGTGIQGAGKAYNWITEPLKYAAEDPSRAGSGEAILGTLLMGAEELTRRGGKGSEMWATGADIQNPITKQPMGNLPRRKDGQPWVDPDVARTAGEALTGALIEGGAAKGIQQLGKLSKSLKIADQLTPSPLAVTPDGLKIKSTNVADDLAIQASQPLKSASDVRPAGKLGGIETLIDEGAEPQILKKLKSKHYDQLDSQYQYVTPENLAKDPDTLKLLREREVAINEYFRDYDKMKSQVHVLKAEAAKLKKSGNTKGSAAKLKKAKRLQTDVDNLQRELYDFATHNIYSEDMRVYGTKSIRTKLRQKFLEFKGKKWHHIFGNKEAGEYMLSAVAQDPIMTVNLMKHLEKLNLPTSGVARNIAIMEDALHTSWHKYMRKEGYEPTGFIKSKGRMKRAPLDPSDYGKEISKAIIEGKADPNELFTFLDVYAKYYKEMLQELTTKYQGKIVADMPEGVEKVLMSHRYQKAGDAKVRRGK